MSINTKEKLKVLRAKANLTQEKLAEKSGLTARTIVAYELDVENLRKAEYRNIEKLAMALGVKVDDIYLG